MTKSGNGIDGNFVRAFILFHWSAIVLTWFLGMDTQLRLGQERLKGLCFRRSSFGAIGVTSAFFGTEQTFKSMLLEIAFGELYLKKS
jgi:hypothetical protein